MGMTITVPRTERLHFKLTLSILLLFAVGIGGLVCCKRPASTPTVASSPTGNAASNGPAACRLTEQDVSSVLGQKMNIIDKSDFRLELSQAERQDPNVNACGFSNTEGAFIYWKSTEFTSEQSAEKAYEDAKGRFSLADPKDASDYWDDNLLAIVDGGYITHGFHGNALVIHIAGRVEKIAFQIRSSSPAANKISFVLLKGLAVRISRSLPTTPR